MGPNRLAKTGAVFFVLWGLLNIFAGLNLLLLAQSGEVIEFFGNTAPNLLLTNNYTGDDLQAIQSLGSFNVFNYIWIGLLVIIIAVKKNWKNDSSGFLINQILMGSISLGFILFNILPGNMPFASGFIVPGLWFIGLVFSYLGLKKDEILEITEAVIPKN